MKPELLFNFTLQVFSFEADVSSEQLQRNRASFSVPAVVEKIMVTFNINKKNPIKSVDINFSLILVCL